MNNSNVLWIRFVGKDLELRSVPVYELAETLIALQRILHKVFLFQNERLEKGALLARDERQRVSLQVVERRKESDAWGLLPFLADPMVLGYVHDLMKAGLVELAKYALKQIFYRDQATNQVVGSALTGAIYAETVTITNHIYNIGNIERIEFSLDAPRVEPVVFDSDTQYYVRSVKNETYLGASTEIEGVVTKLYPNRSVVEIKLAPKRYVKVIATDNDFQSVRYKTDMGDTIRFLGRPRYRLGREHFEEFVADRYLGITHKGDDL